MANDSPGSTPEWSQTGQLGLLRYSLRSLVSKAKAGPVAATLINTTCILIGAAVYYAASGPVAWAGAGFAIVSALGILKWVLRL